MLLVARYQDTAEAPSSRRKSDVPALEEAKMADRRATTATLDTVARQLESLQRHIDSLDRSMQLLAARFPLPEGCEIGYIYRPWQSPYQTGIQPATLEVIRNAIREVDAHIEAIERDFGLVKRGLEAGDDPTPYLTNPKPGRR